MKNEDSVLVIQMKKSEQVKQEYLRLIKLQLVNFSTEFLADVYSTDHSYESLNVVLDKHTQELYNLYNAPIDLDGASQEDIESHTA